jgi:hypothetical protein
MATLQVTEWLIREAIAADEPLSIVDAVTKAIPIAAAKDDGHTWWQAIRVIRLHVSPDKSGPAILADAIAAQGKTNIYASKGPKP